MTAPTVHLNGTSRAELLAGYETAYHAVREASKALQASAPNARDYYTQGPGAYSLAASEHMARASKLQKVEAELLALYEAVYEGQS